MSATLATSGRVTSVAIMATRLCAATRIGATAQLSVRRSTVLQHKSRSVQREVIMKALNMVMVVFLTAACETPEDTARFIEVRCNASKCVGRLSDSASAWVSVFSTAELDQLVLDGAEMSDTWSDGCAAGLSPATFLPEHKCLKTVIASICYAGDGQWWTPVERCVAVGVEPAWLASQCNGMVGQLGEHPWDEVTCYKDEVAVCVGRYGDDLMRVSPTCRFETWDSVEL